MEKPIKIVRRTFKKGYRSETNKFGAFEIMERTKENGIIIKFDGFPDLIKVTSTQIKRCSIRNFNIKTIRGVACLGYGIYSKSTHPKLYNLFSSMISRVYNDEYQGSNNYKDVTVCDEWLNFQNFSKWVSENYGDGNDGELVGLDLDKDLKGVNNKQYNPEHCVMIPQEINKILTLRVSKRGDLPIGVAKCRGKYLAKVNMYGESHTFCDNYTITEAFEKYKLEKEKYLKDVAEKYYNDGKICEDVYNTLINWDFKITD